MDVCFQTERLKLRPFVLSDAPNVQALCSDVEVARTTLLIPHPYPEDAAESWIITNQAAAHNGTRYTFAIELLNDGCLHGCISLNIDKQHSHAELAYWVGRAYWGNGYATEAAHRIFQFGFEMLKLQRIWAAAMTKNLASIRVMQHLSMQYEGTFRQHILKWNHYEDIAFYGLLRSDYDLTSS
jgi:ribosomal-protein-alanine N-acetyltransferase